MEFTMLEDFTERSLLFPRAKTLHLLIYGFITLASCFNPNDYKAISELLIDSSLYYTDIERLAELCDTFGPRYCGTENLELAIDWIVQQMRSEGLQNVQKEFVPNITNWKRNEESLVMTAPRHHKMALLGLGTTIGTGPAGIEGEVLVVTSFDELSKRASEAKGKIVVYNQPWVDYSTTVQYRGSGASAAAKVGAIAALVRSITPYSLYTPHTGSMYYQSGIPQIPCAAITVEDAEMMWRMQNRGQKIRVNLHMGAENGPPNVSSSNIIAEVVGSQSSQEVVVMGGHVDSWDVGQGAMDDGGGLFTSWSALSVINNLILEKKLPRPKRTIRVVLWVNEEMGARGSEVYLADHLTELKNHQLAIETDSGNFDPTGFGFTGTPAAQEIIRNISTLLAPIQANQIWEGQGADTDNWPLVNKGVPGGSLKSTGFSSSPFFYFNYHHSNADTMTALNQNGLRKSVAALAVMSYVAADIPERLPQ
eukprot:TRINITY_DN3110_c0_g1_i1.p1 TRINITY_DN3110_c0_g1~~TRINITY_DN3110_c0_g1_i1.p1  ORF type:complete len:479 (+),score=139.75 TRINITY_DN3110_c0_g1_i1:72-1508(+)